MQSIQKNYLGETINGIPLLRESSYGTGKYDKKGNPIVKWDLLLHADEYGFDIENVEENNRYIIEMKLPKGTIIIRYGMETGHFSAPYGTPYENLSLPYVKESLIYNEYEIVANQIDVLCIVKKGIAAPGFDYAGGGVQYLHHFNMLESINKGMIERKSIWQTNTKKT